MRVFPDGDNFGVAQSAAGGEHGKNPHARKSVGAAVSRLRVRKAMAALPIKRPST